jgi:hypothetical protein
MVKKLETGSTIACAKSLEENVKGLRIAKRKEQKKKINTSAKSLTMPPCKVTSKVIIKPHFTLREVESVMNALKRDT